MRRLALLLVLPLVLPAGQGSMTLTAEQRETGYFALEPMIAFTASGTAFYTAEFGPTLTLVPAILRSQDQGATWQDVTPAALSLVQDPLYTMDPYLHVDKDTGRVFVVHFYPTGLLLGSQLPVLGQDCNVISFSDDEGETWSRVEVCPAADHQTLFTGPPPAGVETTGYPNAVYLCENSGGGSCRTSLDGGVTWSARTRVWPDCGPQMGHGTVGHDGTVYIPRLACEFTFVAGSTPREVAELAISRDAGATWEVVVVDDTAGVQRFDMTTVNDQVHHDAYVSVDAAGNVYYVFLDGQSMPRYTVSVDDGATWSPPQLLAPPGITAARLGAAAAGDAGKLAFGVVATDVAGGWTGDMSAAAWHVYLGVVLGADTDAPALQTTRVTPADDPIRIGPCAGRCPGSHPLGFGMYDFVSLDIDPTTGMAWVSMMDMWAPGVDLQADYPHGAVGVQTGGPRLLG